VAARRVRSWLTIVVVAAALSAAAPGIAAPMQGGGDTRDVSSIPLVVFDGPVRVAPGESSNISFNITNRYNQSIDAVRINASFQVGGSWLEARRLNQSSPDVPRFIGPSPTPFAIAAHATHRVVLPFSTTNNTTSGVYLVALTMTFQYVAASGVRVDSRFASLGSIDMEDRQDVDMQNYSKTIDALGIDGIVPDSSITVDGGEAMRMWLAAAAFGAAVVTLGFAYGWAKRRRGAGRR
jgi:hypothetical protein